MQSGADSCVGAGRKQNPLQAVSSARKRSSVLRSDWLHRPSLEERNARTAYRRTQEILARNRSVNSVHPTIEQEV
jgi:hypothetical protein